MSIVETAKELLKKGIALDDEELIQMANSLLAANETVAQPAQPDRIDADEFAVEPQERRELPTAVNEVQREIIFLLTTAPNMRILNPQPLFQHREENQPPK